jgi:hypothetical protein
MLAGKLFYHIISSTETHRALRNCHLQISSVTNNDCCLLAGKLFYHIISTEVHRALRDCRPQTSGVDNNDCCLLAGKLFYHIISTEAHRALQEANMQRYQQLKDGMRVTLAALAKRFQDLSPAQIDAIKTKIRARQLRQQQQQTMLGRGLAHTAAAAAGEQLQLLQPNAHPAGLSLLPQVQHGGGSTSGVRSAAHISAVAAAGSVSALPLAGSSTSSNSGSRLAGHKRQHSSSNSSRGQLQHLQWSDDVLWILHHYCLLHTSWSSPRSPPYNGLLLDEIAAELFGDSFRVRSAA